MGKSSENTPKFGHIRAVIGEIDFCHIMTGHGLQALADVWPRCDQEVTTLTDLEGGSKKT